MSGLKRLTPQQSRKANALIKKTCCNCMGGMQEEQEKLLSEIAELKEPLTEVQADLKKLRDIRYWVRKATPGTEESKEPPKKQPIKEVLQDKADEKKAQRTVPAQTKHKQQDMEL